MVTTPALVALSFGVFGLRFGQPADELYTKDVGSVVGQRLIDEHYPRGTSYAVQITAAGRSVDAVVAAAAAAAAVHGVVAATPAGVSADGRWVRVEAVLDDPPDSAAAKDTVTGGVITSAGVVLAATFATLVVLPDCPPANPIATAPRHRRSGHVTLD